jgi:hypothetical protein
VYRACSFFTNLDLFSIDNARVIYRKIRYKKRMAGNSETGLGQKNKFIRKEQWKYNRQEEQNKFVVPGYHMCSSVNKCIYFTSITLHRN